MVDREQVKRLLGSWSETREPPVATLIDQKESGGQVVESLRISAGPGDPIPALLFRPVSVEAPSPAILYCHAHGGRYEIGKDELSQGRPALADPPYGPVLAELGLTVLCLDMPTFGERSHQAESALSKACLWRGGSLFGSMLSDLASGLDYLERRDDVDAARIAALGISMGGTHAWWLAALDDRIMAVADLCCFADMDELIATGAHDLHGHYMTVPGLLQTNETGHIAGLIAPRPRLICVGFQDPLTPRPAFDKAHGQTLTAYRAAGAADRLQTVIEPEGGHQETPRMRAAVLSFLSDALGLS